MRLIRSFLCDESGATAIEYGLIAALIGTAVIGGMGAYGTQLSNLFNKVATTLNDTMSETR
ncbi:Flp family type IVb pilin [Neorhizobium sp. JUb45]|uniref:Flp family type IVb pilin n=1 Tax=unclassified Neorhizobium TaxID=2629175 RepID=UPI00104E6251|nr:Flp family type IVb pilin [Neorhizobium sp. JUb45]TCR01018.1 pilus assembly protein Flp/PilA [Neorhizobium sp. JUb45]